MAAKITIKGQEIIARRLVSDVQSVPNLIAIGDGATGVGHSASIADTALVNETFRQTGTLSVKTTNTTNDTTVFSTIFDFITAGDVDELGIFDSANNMFASLTFVKKAMAAGETLKVTVNVINSEV